MYNAHEPTDPADIGTGVTTAKAKKQKMALVPKQAVACVDMTFGKEYQIVPADPDANRKANQIMAQKLRDFLMTHIKQYEGLDKILLPKELLDLTAAAKNVAEISYKAHEGAPPELTQTPVNGAAGVVGAAIYGMTKAIKDSADGKPKAQTADELMAQIDAMAGKASKVSEVVETKKEDSPIVIDVPMVATKPKK